MTCEERIAAAVVAERERIAVWHEQQAATLEAAMDQIRAEGGTIQVTNQTLAELHRAWAKAIREGAA